ncbi:YtrH family sporulation protein [Lucifera butyrica]|nr:YtrH family sporulation protein [Lucifera butyrica]
MYNFAIACGVIVGASLFAGMAALFMNQPPIKTMAEVAASLKIWAVAVALGGTFSSLEVLEQGILKGEIRGMTKHVLYISAALAGANTGCGIIQLLKICGALWEK